MHAAKRLPQREQSHDTTTTDATTEFPFDTVKRTAFFFATCEWELPTEQSIRQQY
ncbi:MAG: hypothetical protein ACI8QT_000999 [Halioglobus sp.]